MPVAPLTITVERGAGVGWGGGRRPTRNRQLPKGVGKNRVGVSQGCINRMLLSSISALRIVNTHILIITQTLKLCADIRIFSYYYYFLIFLSFLLL